MRLSKSTVEATKMASIVFIVGQYIHLKRNGGQFNGLCPFHEERTPSFFVHPTKGYYCFGCDAKGASAISFIMAYEGKSYSEAIIHITEMVGTPIEREEKESVVKFPSIQQRKQLTTINPTSVSLIQNEKLQASLKNYKENYFTQYLVRLFGKEITNQLIRKYFIGTSKHWAGATVFWQVDIHAKIRSGKIMLYDTAMGKRVKKPNDHINWVHTVLKLPRYELNQCFFGENLLKENIKPIALTESEKTAIIASVYFPQFTWLASGGLKGLTSEKCQILKGRSVTLFPDLSGYEEWSRKAKELSHIAKFSVADLLERKATDAEKKQKLDIADYLVKFNYLEFLNLNNKYNEKD